MKQKIDISILMATHNPIEKYMINCLNSIFNQTYKAFEIVIIDDGSTEKVIEMLERLNLKSEKIKIIRLEKSVGLPSALNRGLKECQGKYIARMDDDDIMDMKRLERQREFLENNVQFVGCWSDIELIDREGNLIGEKVVTIKPKHFLKQLVARSNPFCHSSLFIKKEILQEIGGYDENLRYAQDNELYIRVLEQYKMGIVHEKLVQWRRNDYRNSDYRACLSTSFALFASYKFFIKYKDVSIKYWIWMIDKLLHYMYQIFFKQKKTDSN